LFFSVCENFSIVPCFFSYFRFAEKFQLWGSLLMGGITQKQLSTRAAKRVEITLAKKKNKQIVFPSFC